MRIGFNTLFSTRFFESKIKEWNNQKDLAIELVESDVESLDTGNIDAYAYPIHLLQFLNHQELRPLALIELGPRSYSLLIHHKNVASSHHLGLYEDMKVTYSESFHADVLKILEFPMQLEESSSEWLVRQVQQNKQGNFILETCFLPQNASEHYKMIELNEREFGHAAGLGFMAILASPDSKFKKLLRSMNSKDVIAISNIERSTVLKCNRKINVHAEIDRNRNYHLWLLDGDINVHTSQSTRNLIEERIIKKLESI